MTNPVHRRDFLKTTALASVSSFAWSSSAQSEPGEAAPVARARLLPGCCAYSYGSYLGKGKMTMEEFILKAVELGVLGVDITTYWLKSTEPAYLAGLRRLVYRHGMPLSGLAIGADLCQPDPAKRADILETVRKWVDATEFVGASHLRVFGDKLPAGATEQQGIHWVAETMKAACEYAAQKGVTIGLETHNGLSVKSANVREILRQVDSPFAGCNLDISNLRDNPYEQIAACLPWATHVHIRDFYGEARTSLDLDRVWQLFHQSGYQGFLSAEYENQEDALTGVPKLIAKIKTLCQKYSSTFQPTG
jgi:sugar phosphate isomerase/epimerase